MYVEILHQIYQDTGILWSVIPLVECVRCLEQMEEVEPLPQGLVTVSMTTCWLPPYLMEETLSVIKGSAGIAGKCQKVYSQKAYSATNNVWICCRCSWFVLLILSYLTCKLFLSLCVAPLCFKEAIIVPVPKKTPASWLNDYRLVNPAATLDPDCLLS